MCISLPAPNQSEISLRKVEGGVAAVCKFSGKPSEDIVMEKEKALRSNLISDGLKPKAGCVFARYNDPGRTWSFTMVRTTHIKEKKKHILFRVYDSLVVP